MKTVIPTTPSFLFGYWRPWNESSDVIASYLDYTKDVSLARYGSDTIGRYIAQASKEQVQAITKVGDSLGVGFSQLSAGMSAIDSKVSEINGQLLAIDDKLMAIQDKLGFLNRNMELSIEQQRLGNLLLQNIAELLRVPDSERERRHCIEQGIRFFVNAGRDSDLYTDALEMLLRAETLFKQDYFVLHRIGCIYLHAEKHLDPAKALEYFTRAAKYAIVEADPNSLCLANALTASHGIMGATNAHSPNAIHRLAADSYEKAAFAAYVLGDDDKAVGLQVKALELSPSPRNRFTLSKYQVRSGRLEEAETNLNQALVSAPMLLAAVFRDIDLVNESRILRVVEDQSDAKVVLSVIDKRRQLVNLVLGEVASQWQRQHIAKSAFGNHDAERFSKECGRLEQLLEIHSDDEVDNTVQHAFQILNSGTLIAERRGISHQFLVEARLHLKAYERFYRTIADCDKFGEMERATLREIVSRLSRAGVMQKGPESPDQGEDASNAFGTVPVLAHALTLVAAADGVVGIIEQSAIAESIQKMGFNVTSEQVSEWVHQAVAEIRIRGIPVYAKDVRDRLMPHRDTKSLLDLFAAMVEVAEHDGTVHANEMRVIDWFRRNLSK